MTGYRAYNKVFAKTMPVPRRASRSRPSFPSTPSTSAGASPRCPSTTATAPRDRSRSCPPSPTASGAHDDHVAVQGLRSRWRCSPWVALLFVVLGLVAGVPVIAQFAATGLVPKLPRRCWRWAWCSSACCASRAALSWTTVVKGQPQAIRDRGHGKPTSVTGVQTPRSKPAASRVLLSRREGRLPSAQANAPDRFTPPIDDHQSTGVCPERPIRYVEMEPSCVRNMHNHPIGSCETNCFLAY